MEIEGIKTDSKRLEEAKKHTKIGEYREAKKLLDEILRNDHFNIEAQCEWIKNVLLFYKLEENCISQFAFREENIDLWNYISEIVSRFNKLEKIDEEKLYKTFLKDYIVTLDYLKKEYEKLLEDEAICKELSEEITKEIWHYTVGGDFDVNLAIFSDAFDIGDISYHYSYTPNQCSFSVDGRFKSVKVIRNGCVQIIYTTYDYAPYVRTIYPKCELSSIKETKEKAKQCLDTLRKNKGRGTYRIKRNLSKIPLLKEFMKKINKC